MSSPLVPGQRRRGAGLASAVAAYGMWGLLPLYFKALPGVGALEILAHRVAGSAVLLAVVIVLRLHIRRSGTEVPEPDVTLRRRGRDGFARLRAARLRVLVATTALIAVNWGLYIWAVQAGRVLEASLGYFVNPLVNVALGVGFLHEALRPRQRAAFVLAGTGVVALVVSTGTVPWIALVLATTFGFYGLLRKRADVEPVGGLFAETALLAPPAFAFLGWLAAHGEGAFGRTVRETVLLALAGAITSVPLLAFGHAVRRLRLSTLGIVQYLAPTGQFLLAVLAFGEPFGRAQAFAFTCIWGALAIYTWDAIASARAPAPEPLDGAA